MMPREHQKNLPYVTRSQMIEIDRLMVEDYGITLMQMMENAGRNLAELSRCYLNGLVSGKKILVLCGGGNNGGGGMAAARHLVNHGGEIWIAMVVGETKIKNAPVHQMETLRKMGVPITTDFPDQAFDLLLDAMIGYGLSGAPRGKAIEWINWLNSQPGLKISLDIPSGLDADSGSAPGACVIADATLTLALPKIGMVQKKANRFVGDLFVGDISVPQKLLAELGIIGEVAFSGDHIIQLDLDG